MKQYPTDRTAEGTVSYNFRRLFWKWQICRSFTDKRGDAIMKPFKQDTPDFMIANTGTI